MARSIKAKKSGVPVIGEKEYAEYIDFLKREDDGREDSDAVSSKENEAKKSDCENTNA